MKVTDPVERELARIRADKLRDLQRLGQEWDYPERLQADDEFRPTASMWAVVICAGLSVTAILFAVFLEWLAS